MELFKRRFGFFGPSPANIFTSRLNSSGVVSAFHYKFAKGNMCFYNANKSITKVVPSQLYVIDARNLVQSKLAWVRQ